MTTYTFRKFVEEFKHRDFTTPLGKRHKHMMEWCLHQTFEGKDTFTMMDDLETFKDDKGVEHTWEEVTASRIDVTMSEDLWTEFCNHIKLWIKIGKENLRKED